MFKNKITRISMFRNEMKIEPDILLFWCDFIFYDFCFNDKKYIAMLSE